MEDFKKKLAERIKNEVANYGEIEVNDNSIVVYSHFDDGAKRFYQREINYILSKGYTFESTGDGLWKAVRK